MSKFVARPCNQDVSKTTSDNSFLIQFQLQIHPRVETKHAPRCRMLHTAVWVYRVDRYCFLLLYALLGNPFSTHVSGSLPISHKSCLIHAQSVLGQSRVDITLGSISEDLVGMSESWGRPSRALCTVVREVWICEEVGRVRVFEKWRTVIVSHLIPTWN